MRHSTTLALTLLALGMNLAAVSCAMPSRGARPTDARDGRTTQAPTRSTTRLSDMEQEAVRLERQDDDRALVVYLDKVEADPRFDALAPEARGRLELMRARALVRLDRKLSALTAFGGAWQEVTPDVDGVGTLILEEWADHEMAMADYRPAVKHYELALKARNLTPDREQDLRCCLVVASEELV